jgi:hypothetical protein
MFEKSQRKNNILDYHNLFGFFSLIVKITCSKFNTNQKSFYMFKALKLQK